MDLRNTSTPYGESLAKANTLLSMALDPLNFGGTIERVSGKPANFESGYVVGGLVPTLVFDADTQVDEFIYHVARFIDRQSSTVEYVGVWKDESTGMVHVDAVQWVESRVTAETLGIQRGELAIWDCANGEEIRL